MVDTKTISMFLLRTDTEQYSAFITIYNLTTIIHENYCNARVYLSHLPKKTESDIKMTIFSIYLKIYKKLFSF